MKTLRVLVVEDESIVAMLIEDILTDLGHQVVATVGRVDQALSLAAELQIDVALLDLNLNGQDTYGVAEVLVKRNIALIFATGYGPSGVREEWRNHKVLQKPFDDSQLAEILNQLEVSIVGN